MITFRLLPILRLAHLWLHRWSIVVDGLIVTSYDALARHLHLVVLTCYAALCPLVRTLVGPGLQTRLSLVRREPVLLDLSDARSHSFSSEDDLWANFGERLLGKPAFTSCTLGFGRCVLALTRRTDSWLFLLDAGFSGGCVWLVEILVQSGSLVHRRNRWLRCIINQVNFYEMGPLSGFVSIFKGILTWYRADGLGELMLHGNIFINWDLVSILDYKVFTWTITYGSITIIKTCLLFTELRFFLICDNFKGCWIDGIGVIWACN